jgi:hypothetical protein
MTMATTTTTTTLSQQARRPPVSPSYDETMTMTMVMVIDSGRRINSIPTVLDAEALFSRNEHTL